MSSKKPVIATVVVVILAIVIGLIASSLKKVENEEVGLQYNVIDNTLKKKVYLPGLHTGPPGFKFIIFPRVYNSISFGSVNCLNQNGLSIKLSLTFQYLISLNQDDLYTIVKRFRDHENYKEVIQDAAQAVVHDVCSEFTVTEFQTKRAAFQEKILTDLQQRMLQDFKTNVRDVQVKDIVRPKEYEDVVKLKEVAKQNIDLAEEERPRVLTAAQTKIEEARTEAQIKIETAETEARIMITKANSQAEAILNAYNVEANTYSAIMKDQQLTVPGFLSYLTTRALEVAKNPVKINMNAPAKTTYP